MPEASGTGRDEKRPFTEAVQGVWLPDFLFLYCSKITWIRQAKGEMVYPGSQLKVQVIMAGESGSRSL